MAVLLQKALFRADAMIYAAGGEKGAHGQSPLTLVTAYFELGGKPENPEWGNPYPGWIRNFLPHVRWPLVVFCDKQSLDMLKEARGDKLAVWHVTRPEDFYAYRYLDDLKRLPCRASHGDATIPRKVFVARSLIWHEKHHFLRQALSENPFGSEMLFWCDIGQFRHKPDAPWWSTSRRTFRLLESIEWPSFGACRVLPQDKVVLVHAIYDAMHGAFFGGAIEPSRRWCDAYYRCLEQQKQNGSFCHREEYVMMSCWRRRQELAYVMLPDCAPYIGYFPGSAGKLGFKYYFLNGRRFPWRYCCRRLFSGPVR